MSDVFKTKAETLFALIMSVSRLDEMLPVRLACVTGDAVGLFRLCLALDKIIFLSTQDGGITCHF